MGKETGIKWCDHTFNPWWGCAKVSAGCKFCYAEGVDKVYGGGAHWGIGAPRREFGDKHWNEPRRWNKQALKDGVRRRVFCASMADVFDPEAPKGALDRLWQLIRVTPQLDWLLLTKRPERIASSLPADWGNGWHNVWLGTSVENQEAADKRIPVLLGIPAVVRFLSCEPLLGRVDLTEYLTEPLKPEHKELAAWRNGVEWVIVGGESGSQARPMEAIWVNFIIDDVRLFSDAAIFFKQAGQWLARGLGLKHKKGEDPNEWNNPLWVQEFPKPK